MVTDPLGAVFDPVYQTGNWVADGAFSSTFSGWISSFPYTADFDLVRVYVQAETLPATIRAIVATSDTTVLADARLTVSANGWHTFALSRRCLAADFSGTNVGYIGLMAGSNATRIARPAVVVNDARPNQTTYHEYYSATTNGASEPAIGALLSATWGSATGAGAGASNMIAQLVDSRSLQTQFQAFIPTHKGVQQSYAGAPAVVQQLVMPNAASQRGTPWSGWGTVYNNVGVGQTFNAVRLPYVNRATTVTADSDKWSQIRFEVRDVNATGTLKAIGVVDIDPDTGTLYNVEALLQNPATGAAITLNPATDLSSTFAILYTARNMAGGFAVVSECLCASVPNGNGTYYSFATTNAGIWGTHGNVSGVDLLLVTAPVIATSRQLTKRQEPTLLAARVAALEAATPNVLALSSQQWAVVGREFNVYQDGLLPDAEAFWRDWSVTCAKGQQLAECFRYTPVAGDVGAVPITLQPVNTRNAQMRGAAASASITVTAATAGAATARKVLLVGDSTTAGGDVAVELANLFTGDANLPVTLVGSQGTGAAKHEGRSGWAIATFTSAGSPFYSGGAMNIGAYATANGITAIDRVIINLGINDASAYLTDASITGTGGGWPVFAQRMDMLIAAFKAYNVNIRIGVALTTPPSASQDSFGASYGTRARWRYKRSLWLFWVSLLRYYGARTGENIDLLPYNTAIDTLNNMQLAAAAPVNARNPAVTIQRQTNSVHPMNSGYLQVADTAYAWLKAKG